MYSVVEEIDDFEALRKRMIAAGYRDSTVLDSIDCSSLAGLRDRALIALMTYSFARVGTAAGKMRVEDVFVQGRRSWVRLDPKGYLFPTIKGSGKDSKKPMIGYLPTACRIGTTLLDFLF